MRRHWSLAAALACTLAAWQPARAQGLNAEVLGDIVFWQTDDGSRLLARNSGSALADVHVHGFLSFRPSARIELRSITEFEASTERDSDAEVEVELISLRVHGSRALNFEAGKILMPVGGYAIRRFAHLNPLNGDPDLYPPTYPWGALVDGAFGRFDYAVGAVSQPVYNPNYSPEPSDRLRPIARVGFAPSEALRMGAAVTHGSYLGNSISAMLPTGTRWQDFDQTVVATDFRFSADNIVTHAEVAWSSYEVPTVSEPVSGWGAFGEVKVAHTPRIFSALRVERFRYPFVRPLSTTNWRGVAITQWNAEIGAGYRLSRSGLAKISYRRDYWPEDPLPGAPPAPDGYALAVQFSYLLDIAKLFEPKY